jgi:RimJ/RimL family protein N-acetyltransferase
MQLHPSEVAMMFPQSHAESSPLLRPIEPGDFERERRFVDGLSPQTGYQRLMSPRRPSDDELRRWTHIDPAREGALVAIVSSAGEERQVGVARYVVEDGTDEAEFAIVISDDWHGKGLGRQLLSALIDLARRSGVTRLVGTTLSENKAMLGLGRRLGFKLSRERGSAFVTMMSLTLLPEAGATTSLTAN